MIATRNIMLLTIALTAPGCQWRSVRQEPRIVDPALPMAMSRNELVDHLNRHNQGLQSWRCMDTRVHVSMPGMPLPQKLSGSIACSAPSQFRLKADSFIFHTDFGSNKDVCWAFVKPGESAVLTWRHEDSHLLQHIPGGLPRLEPSWLMTILGVQPLNADDYELQSAPAGSRELWLVAIEDAPDGTSLRRVIKVDTVTGVAREHALYDSERNPLLRARLSHHRTCGGHLMPHQVVLDFPQNETQLTLTFNGIETDCQIAASLWNPPHGRGIEHVDLGDIVRRQLQHESAVMKTAHSKPATEVSLRNGQQQSPARAMPTTAPSADDRLKVNQSDEWESDDRFYGGEPEGEAGNQLYDDESGDVWPVQSAEISPTVRPAAPDFDITSPTRPPQKRFRWKLPW